MRCVCVCVCTWCVYDEYSAKKIKSLELQLHSPKNRGKKKITNNSTLHTNATYTNHGERVCAFNVHVSCCV